MNIRDLENAYSELYEAKLHALQESGASQRTIRRALVEDKELTALREAVTKYAQNEANVTHVECRVDSLAAEASHVECKLEK